MADNSGERLWLLNIRSSSEDLHEYILKPGHNYLGRKAGNDLVLLDNAASAHHDEIYYDKSTNSLTIWDFESTNGTFVNGKRIHKPYGLQHEDQIRIGHFLISVIFSNKIYSSKKPSHFTPTKVTKELILESVEQYGVLLHEIGQRLISIPDLGAALSEIVELVKRMIGAEECHVILADKFDSLQKFGVPVSIAQKTIENQSATIFSNSREELSGNKVPNTQPLQSMLLVPVIIDLRVVALIFAKKSKQLSKPFINSDLQLALAVSNQVAMSIQRNWVEGELIHNSNHDSLTDLPNRTLFLQRLNQSIERSKQKSGKGFSVLFFDIDDFKIVNDSLGHATGDKLLIAVAERLKHNIRNIDIVTRNSVIARFGGDEFAILLDNISEIQFAMATANRLKGILSKPFNINGKQIFSTVSIGVAVSTMGYENPDDILRDADLAMYQAKELGKSRVEVYDKEMHARISKRMQMGTALRQGALQQEFRLHYQPVVSLNTGRIVGFEALVRWYTPDRGILNPADFMDAIDTAGLVYSTDHWVLQNACRQAVEWRNKFPNNRPVSISVNLSAKNIKHPNLITNINKVLQVTNLKPERLWLEITEKVSAPDDKNAIEVLKKLRSIGVRICLDDFGTGYSALNYLALFPVDVLKIDRSFINMIGNDGDSQKIIEMITALANHLRLVVIAEGVEKEEQLTFLKSINCEYAQGYFFAKPLDAHSATELLASGSHW
jgi:diguanylate cyclase (GGDEF)-like protein